MLTQDSIESMDINVLVSLVNLKLRDYFDSAASLARYYDIDMNSLSRRLSQADFIYYESLNQFRPH
jgi:hypothetical protein